MMLLGLDTATTACSVALWSEDAVVAHRRIDAGRRHAEVLVPLLGEVVEAANTTLASVDFFAVTIGPGSFTGIRVGLATARGLALAAARPLIGLSTLEVLAAGVPDSARTSAILATIDARRDRLYVQWFDDAISPLSEPCAVRAAELPAILPPAGRGVVVVGTGADVALDALGDAIDAKPSPGLQTPDARSLVRLAAARAHSATFDASAVPRPLYLRDPGADMPRKRGAAHEVVP
jgi:tRNA threonylcarbamoyladenosine biosynthesis protein TsaB